MTTKSSIKVNRDRVVPLLFEIRIIHLFPRAWIIHIPDQRGGMFFPTIFRPHDLRLRELSLRSKRHRQQHFPIKTEAVGKNDKQYDTISSHPRQK
jgi:hypothetical protein